MFERIRCPNCNADGFWEGTGDGKCAECRGSGYMRFLDALPAALTGQSQACETCGGDGKCQTCYGKGYLAT